MNVRAVSGPGPELSFGTFNRENKERARVVPGPSDGSSLSSLGTNRGIPSSLQGQTAVGREGIRDDSSESGVVSRVMADIDAVGSVPAQVSVYSQPEGRGVMTDVVVHQTDNNDGTRKVGNHWQEGSVSGSASSAPPPANGLGASGLRVGAYEESRVAAREAFMMFQGMKVNQTV